MCLSSLSCDTMICANFKVADSLPDESFAGIQCVVAYTTSFGERRIRVHSLRLPTSSNYRKVIAAIDLDALVYLNCSRYMEACLSQDLSSVREQVIEDCVSPLTGFKFNSGENVGQGLALPEALRLYPMYQSCLLKSPLLKDNPLRYAFQVRNWSQLTLVVWIIVWLNGSRFVICHCETSLCISTRECSPFTTCQRWLALGTNPVT